MFTFKLELQRTERERERDMITNKFVTNKKLINSTSLEGRGNVNIYS